MSRFYLITLLIRALDIDTNANTTTAQEIMFSKLTTEDVAEMKEQYKRLGKELDRLVAWWKWEGYGESNQK